MARRTLTGSVVVWDPLLRILHWALAASIAVAFASAEASMAVHLWAGLGALGIVATRVVWGLIGPCHARFGDFIPTPWEAARYLADRLHGRGDEPAGHNPLGGLMVVALLLTVLATVATGLLGWGGALSGEVGEELHEGVAWVLAVLIGLHVGGVILSSLLERQNLIIAMITGRKRVDTS